MPKRMTDKLFLSQLAICDETGKPCYDKRGALSAKNKRWQQDRTKLRIYPCHDHWHLTSLNPDKL